MHHLRVHTGRAAYCKCAVGAYRDFRHPPQNTVGAAAHHATAALPPGCRTGSLPPPLAPRSLTQQSLAALNLLLGEPPSAPLPLIPACDEALQDISRVLHAGSATSFLSSNVTLIHASLSIVLGELPYACSCTLHCRRAGSALVHVAALQAQLVL